MISFQDQIPGSEDGSPDFSRIGVMRACLKEAGKVPCENERFASLAMSVEKTPEHDLRSDVGTKSRAEDLGGIELRMPKTSLGVTGESKSRVGHSVSAVRDGCRQ